MASMRGEASDSYRNKLDRMGVGISTSSTGAKAEGHVYPQDDGSQGNAQGKRATGYETQADNERMVSEKKPKPRLDRPAFKKGGRVKGTTVNVIVAPQGGGDAPPPPMPPPGAMPPPPPHAPPGPPMPPPGGPSGPGMPPGLMGRKHGGPVHMTAGAGGGKGRLQKIREYGANAKG